MHVHIAFFIFNFEWKQNNGNWWQQIKSIIIIIIIIRQMDPSYERGWRNIDLLRTDWLQPSQTGSTCDENVHVTRTELNWTDLTGGRSCEQVQLVRCERALMIPQVLGHVCCEHGR